MKQAIAQVLGFAVLALSCKTTAPQQESSSLHASATPVLPYGNFSVLRYIGQNSDDSRIAGGTVSIIRAPVGSRMDAVVSYLDADGKTIRSFDLDYREAYTDCSKKCYAYGPNGRVSFRSFADTKWVMEAQSLDGIPYALDMRWSDESTIPSQPPVSEKLPAIAIAALEINGLMEYVSATGNSPALAIQAANTLAKKRFGQEHHPYVDSECVKRTPCIAIAQVRGDSGARACGVGATIKESAKAAQAACQEAFGERCISAFEACQK